MPESVYDCGPHGGRKRRGSGPAGGGRCGHAEPLDHECVGGGGVVDDYDYERGVVGYLGVGEIRGCIRGKGGSRGRGSACLPEVGGLGEGMSICARRAESVHNAAGSFR